MKKTILGIMTVSLLIGMHSDIAAVKNDNAERVSIGVAYLAERSSMYGFNYIANRRSE